MAISVWGSCDPLPKLATMTLPGVIGWSFPTSRTLSTRGVWNFLKRGPPTPCPSELLVCQRRGESTIPCLIFTPLGVEQQLKIFRDDFLVAAAPRLHHLVPPHFGIPCFDNPPKHNAVPINKVDGRLRGDNPVGVGVGVAHHPMGAFGKGFGAEGGSLEMKGGAHEDPQYRCTEVVL